MARRMLADELGDFLNPAPRHEPDPDNMFGEEGGLIHGSDDELQAQLDDAQRPSRLRMRPGIELDGEEYRGRRSSRAALFGGDEFGLGGGGDGGSGSGDDDDDEGALANGFGGGSSSEEEGDEGGEEEDGAGGASGSGGGDDDDDMGAGGSSDDGGDGVPEEAGSRRPRGQRAGAGGGGSEEPGSSGDDGGGGGSDSDGGGGHMVAALQRYQQDPEMEELERQHEALRQKAGEAAAARQERGSKEAAKARAVRAQRQIWERALEARILLQRPLAAAARLPRPDTRDAAAAASGDVRKGYTALMASCQDTLDALLDLHTALLQRHPQASAAAAAAAAQQQAAAAPAASGKRGRDAAGLDGGGGGAARAWARVEAAVASAAPFRDGSLDKWHRRTVLSSGAAALRGGGGLRALQQSVTVQVASLMRDAARLVTRTQLTRALAPRPLCAGAAAAAQEPEGEEGAAGAGDGAAAERDPETFDDGEFYQQMLKELIESGAASGAGAGAALQRPPKRRKAVDRRASKGRKLRFHVMDKLVGFCAPVELEPPPFAAQLFGNLFGAGGGGGAGGAARA